MNLVSTVLLALAMSTDAFAAAVGKGATLHKPQIREAIRTGIIFGSIEAITPVIGWSLGIAAAKYVVAWDHWIAFTLLGLLGLRMIFAGFRSLTRSRADRDPTRSGRWRRPDSPQASTLWPSAWGSHF